MHEFRVFFGGIEEVLKNLGKIIDIFRIEDIIKIH